MSSAGLFWMRSHSLQGFDLRSMWLTSTKHIRKKCERMTSGNKGRIFSLFYPKIKFRRITSKSWGWHSPEFLVYYNHKGGRKKRIPRKEQPEQQERFGTHAFLPFVKYDTMGRGTLHLRCSPSFFLEKVFRRITSKTGYCNLSRIVVYYTCKGERKKPQIK